MQFNYCALDGFFCLILSYIIYLSSKVAVLVESGPEVRPRGFCLFEYQAMAVVHVFHILKDLRFLHFFFVNLALP